MVSLMKYMYYKKTPAEGANGLVMFHAIKQRLN